MKALKRLQEICMNATRGEWVPEWDEASQNWKIQTHGYCNAYVYGGKEDADFIAVSHKAMSALIELAEAQDEYIYCLRQFDCKERDRVVQARAKLESLEVCIKAMKE